MAHVIAALCRHGSYRQPDQVPSAHLLYPLTTAGQSQAEALADALVELTGERAWDLHPVLDCSPLQRAYQTAQIVADRLAARLARPFQVEEFGALTERCVGAAANLRTDEIEAILAEDPRFEAPPPGWKAASEYRLPFPGAESLLEAGDRCARHMRARAGELQGREARTILKVFVGHGAAFRHAAVHLGALSLSDIPRLSMHHARAVCLSTAESANWTLVAGQWKNREAKQQPD